MMDSDILVELSLDNLKELREIYKKVASAFYVPLLIDTIIRWKESGVEAILPLSCNDSWRNDGTIVCIFDEELTQIFVHSLDPDNGSLRQGLCKTKRIDYSRPVRFLNVMPHCIKVVEEALQHLKMENVRFYENYLYSMSIEKAKTFEENCPADMYIRRLDVNSAPEINRVWPHKFENSEKIVTEYIKRNVGYGLFKKDSDDLICWVLQGPLGHINLLQTQEKYKGKGLGKLMCRVIAKSVAEEGHRPTATVIVTNTPSVNLFNKLGFEQNATSYFVTIGE